MSVGRSSYERNSIQTCEAHGSAARFDRHSGRPRSELARADRGGLDFAAAERVKAQAESTDAELAKLLGVGEATLRRARGAGGALDVATSDRLYRLTKVLSVAEEALEGFCDHGIYTVESARYRGGVCVRIAFARSARDVRARPARSTGHPVRADYARVTGSSPRPALRAKLCPRHVRFDDVRVVAREAFSFDERLWQRPRRSAAP